ncbi:hypothetical protein SAMN05428975_4119 [Mucilaginibacter sp. OK268]|nr:hypothetical protein SAMN05428975_4119 [Mucilaginibacter sp. OK268]
MQMIKGKKLKAKGKRLLIMNIEFPMMKDTGIRKYHYSKFSVRYSILRLPFCLLPFAFNNNYLIKFI